MRRIVLAIVLCLATGVGCGPGPVSRGAAGETQVLLDGTSLAGWRVPETGAFRRHGEVRVAEGAVRLAPGRPMTGIAWTGSMPRSEYEVEVEVCRTAGSDFFCGLTFPVGASHCTWIVGGWGGEVVGLSNVDGKSAAENATTSRAAFETGRWYRLRVRVTEARIACFIDGRQVIDQPRDGHTFAIWPQQQPMRPLGIAAYLTGSAVRRVTLRRPDG